MIILGCGYLGTALARRALAEGRPVAALTRNATTAEKLRALGVSPVVEADIGSEIWHDLVNPAGATIVNCVAPSASGTAGYRHSFISGARSIARWLEKSAAAGGKPARELVFTSSTGVYPQTDGAWVDEATPVEAAALSEAGTVLREAEDVFLALPCQRVARAWVLRLGGLYGPERHQLLDALREGKRNFPGGGVHWVNLLHTDDATGAIHACIQAPAEISGGVFNVVDGEPVLKSELVTWLATRLGIAAATLQFEKGESTRSTHRQPRIGKTPHRRIANRRLRETLGWSPLYRSYKKGYEVILMLKSKKP